MIVEPMMESAISNRLAYCAGSELVKAFGFDREFAFDVHVIRSYSVEGNHFFSPHRDNGAPATVDRAFAVPLNLDDDFEHEAPPVIRCRRFVRTTFFRQKK
jgi:hypothetical protein